MSCRRSLTKIKKSKLRANTRCETNSYSTTTAYRRKIRTRRKRWSKRKPRKSMTTFRSFRVNCSKSIAKCLANRSKQICRISLRQNRKEWLPRATTLTQSETAWTKEFVILWVLILTRIQFKGVLLAKQFQLGDPSSPPWSTAVTFRHFRTRVSSKKLTQWSQKLCKMRCRGTKIRCWTKNDSTSKYSNITLKRLRTTKKRCSWRTKWDARNTWETRKSCSSRSKPG